MYNFEEQPMCKNISSPVETCNPVQFFGSCKDTIRASSVWYLQIKRTPCAN